MYKRELTTSAQARVCGVEPPPGLEPGTYSLRVSCSTS